MNFWQNYWISNLLQQTSSKSHWITLTVDHVHHKVILSNLMTKNTICFKGNHHIVCLPPFQLYSFSLLPPEIIPPLLTLHYPYHPRLPFSSAHAATRWLGFMAVVLVTSMKLFYIQLRWVTICGYAIWVCNQPLQPTQLPTLSGMGNTGQEAVAILSDQKGWHRTGHASQILRYIQLWAQ